HAMSGNLTQLSHKHFVQATEYNSLLGEIKRDYQELESDLTSNADFKRLVFDFVKICGIYWNETEVGVHQIRITSKDKMPAYPTPEGVHVDGFDFVGIFCAGRNNIQGGETCLYLEREAEPIYRRTLEPGEFLIFDDRKLLHYTSQVEASNSNSGTRDVFILTASVIGSQIIENRPNELDLHGPDREDERHGKTQEKAGCERWFDRDGRAKICGITCPTSLVRNSHAGRTQIHRRGLWGDLAQ